MLILFIYLNFSSLILKLCVLGSDSLHKHEQLPLVSYEKIDFVKNKIYYGQQIPLELKIHGKNLIWITAIPGNTLGVLQTYSLGASAPLL